MKLNKYIDHTILKPETTQEQVEKTLSEAKEYDFASVWCKSNMGFIWQR